MGTMKKRRFADFEVVVVQCALGLEWEVREARETKYGFDLLYGKRKNPSPFEIGGPNRLIYSNELKAFWTKHSLRHDGILFDLPAGRTTLKRARQALGFHFDKDSERFWRKHKVELKELKPREFEASFKQRYEGQKLSGVRMSFWRLRLLGGKARPLGWWREPEIIRLLLSEEKTLSQVRAELTEAISTSQAFRLRQRARREYAVRNGEMILLEEETPLGDPLPEFAESRLSPKYQSVA